MASTSAANTGHSIGGMTRRTLAYRGAVRVIRSATGEASGAMTTSYAPIEHLGVAKKAGRLIPTTGYATDEYIGVKPDVAAAPAAPSGRAGQRQLGAGGGALAQYGAAKA